MNTTEISSTLFKPEWISFCFFALAGLVHILFFILESFLLQKEGGYKILKISPTDHAAIKPWAFNQGFYNLFLALGIFVGLYFVLKTRIQLAGVITSLFGLGMIGAGLVLFFSVPKLRLGAYLQIVPPLLGFAFLAFHIVGT